MRRPNTREFWETETAWIEAEAHKDRPMLAFSAYRTMQANFATQDGFHDLAERIIAARPTGNMLRGETA
jgi:hypothetical protein